MFGSRRLTDDDGTQSAGAGMSSVSGVRIIGTRAHATQSNRIVRIRGADVQEQNPIYMMDTENDQLVNDDEYEENVDDEREAALRIDTYLDEVCH